MIKIFKKSELKEFLEEKYERYCQTTFIDTDPIQVPHQFTRKEDIEIAGFLTAILAWGQRKVIITNALKLMRLMDYSPYQFIIHSTPSDLKVFGSFKHRTFTSEDCLYFIIALKNIYLKWGGLERIFNLSIARGGNLKNAISSFRNVFFELNHLKRTEKHISNVDNQSAAKRLNMFLRWMIRPDTRNIDFSLWKDISPSHLFIPLDVHTARVSRGLGLLQRKQNDWQAVEELTFALQEFDPTDPIKYDFALFGLGVFEKLFH